MWIYEKKLEFPVKIKTPDARLAKIMIETIWWCRWQFDMPKNDPSLLAAVISFFNPLLRFYTALPSSLW